MLLLAILKNFFNLHNQIMNQLVKTKCRKHMILLANAINNYVKTISKYYLIIHIYIIKGAHKIN